MTSSDIIHANGLLIDSLWSLYALYGIYLHTRINNPLRINIRDLLPRIQGFLAPQSVITYHKHCLASILNSIVSSILSHWVLPHYAVVSAPFEKLHSRKLVQTAKWYGRRPEVLSDPKCCLSCQSELRSWEEGACNACSEALPILKGEATKDVIHPGEFVYGDEG